jgi:hypothetical protein
VVGGGRRQPGGDVGVAEPVVPRAVRERRARSGGHQREPRRRPVLALVPVRPTRRDRRQGRAQREQEQADTRHCGLPLPSRTQLQQQWQEEQVKMRAGGQSLVWRPLLLSWRCEATATTGEGTAFYKVASALHRWMDITRLIACLPCASVRASLAHSFHHCHLENHFLPGLGSTRYYCATRKCV